MKSEGGLTRNRLCRCLSIRIDALRDAFHEIDWEESGGDGVLHFFRISAPRLKNGLIDTTDVTTSTRMAQVGESSAHLYKPLSGETI